MLSTHCTTMNDFHNFVNFTDLSFGIAFSNRSRLGRLPRRLRTRVRHCGRPSGTSPYPAPCPVPVMRESVHLCGRCVWDLRTRPQEGGGGGGLQAAPGIPSDLLSICSPLTHICPSSTNSLARLFVSSLPSSPALPPPSSPSTRR